MIRIYSEGDRITCTEGDAFLIDVTCAGGFNENETLNFRIAANEGEESLIDKDFQPKRGAFEIVLSEQEIELIPIGEYVYKLAIKDSNGRVTTKKSGEFIVKWGA